MTSVDGISWKIVDNDNYMNWISLANGSDKYVGLVDSYDKTLVVASE